jgi:hypothetical protein
VDKEFEKEEELKQKLQRLQVAVFKNFTIKKSKSVLHPPDSLPRYSSLREQTSPQLQTLTPSPTPSSQLTAVPAVTTIKFNIRNSSQSARSLNSFTPRRSIQFNVKKSPLKQEEAYERHKRFLEKGVLHKTISDKVKLAEMRDSQTILRKNALFLVNCLKTRYKESCKNAHLGEFSQGSNIKQGSLNEKNQGNLQYQQRFEYMEEAKQRMMQSRLEKVDSKLERASPLLPEPW